MPGSQAVLTSLVCEILVLPAYTQPQTHEEGWG